MSPPPASGFGPTGLLRRGVVLDYDSPAGLGTVEEASGARHPFHCTAITDGTREIDPGVAVVFVLCAGHLGRFEASDIEQLG